MESICSSTIGTSSFGSHLRITASPGTRTHVYFICLLTTHTLPTCSQPSLGLVWDSFVFLGSREERLDDYFEAPPPTYEYTFDHRSLCVLHSSCTYPAIAWTFTLAIRTAADTTKDAYPEYSYVYALLRLGPSSWPLLPRLLALTRWEKTSVFEHLYLS